MQPSPRRATHLLILAAGFLAAWAMGSGLTPARDATPKGPDDAAISRARDTVQMLDDVYKAYVINITDTYVDTGKPPAAKVTKKVFQHMKKKGWHTGRLVDTTGDPVNRANLPQSEFEKTAVAKLKAGKSYYDEIAYKDNKLVLRAATVVPVVMKKCIDCHPGKKEGELIGALVYEVPIK
jgi:hypothetical protein